MPKCWRWLPVGILLKIVTFGVSSKAEWTVPNGNAGGWRKDAEHSASLLPKRIVPEKEFLKGPSPRH
jgi:hypothetical protein